MLDKLTFLNNLKVYLFDTLEAALVIRLGVIYEDQAKLVPNSEVGLRIKVKSILDTTICPLYINTGLKLYTPHFTHLWKNTSVNLKLLKLNGDTSQATCNVYLINAQHQVSCTVICLWIYTVLFKA